MPRLYVRLDDKEMNYLAEVSKANRRHPSDQAAVLLADALRARKAGAQLIPPDVGSAGDIHDN